MKCWTPILVFAWLFLAALAAYSNEEMRQLLASKGHNGVIEITEDNYKEFLNGARDYHLVLYMSSDSPQLNCLLCREVHPIFATVADSWNRFFPSGTPEDELDIYFLDAEFVSAKKLFQLMQLESIPKIYHFPPSQASDSPNIWLRKRDEYQFYAGDHTVMLKQFITSITGHQFDIYVPFNWSKMFLNAALTFTLIMFVRKFSYYFVAVLKSRFVWGSLSLVLILIFIAGYMFNQIRGAPFVNEQGDHVEYFAPNAQLQYGLETQVISTVYGLLSMAFVLLVTKVGTIKHAKVQLFAILLMSALIYVLYSLFMTIFSIKYRGYPYALLHLPIF